MDLGLADKVAVVTGANQGIGLAVTRALLAEGAHGVAGSLTTDNLDGLDRVTAGSVDLAGAEGPALLVARAVQPTGGSMCWSTTSAACGSVPAGSSPPVTTSSNGRSTWTSSPPCGRRGPRWGQCSNRARARDRSSTWLRSTRSSSPTATVDYGVAKAAVVNLSQSLAQEFGSRGIRVNCVSPGQVSTDLWLGEHGVAETIGQATGVDAASVRAAAVAGIATGRFSTPEEVAALITMLASERMANVTGVNRVIDGGLVKTT